MAAIDIHNESPINSNETSADDLIAAIMAAEEELSMMAADHTSDMDYIVDNSSSMYPTPTEEDSEIKQLTMQDAYESKASPSIAESTKSPSPAHSPMETVMEDGPLAKPSAQPTSVSTINAPAKPPIATDWHTYYSAANKPCRSVPRVHTRNTSISATMDLPWTIDNTSSSSPQTSLARNPSISIPPPPKANELTRSPSNATSSPTVESPKLHPLMTRVQTQPPQPQTQHQYPTSPAPYATHTAPSPYSSLSTTTSTSFSGTHSTSSASEPHSLTHPPNYHQNTHASFSNIPISTTNISTNPTTPSTSRPSSSSYSPLDKSAPPLYTSKTYPFYNNSSYNPNYSSTTTDYSNSLFSPTFSFGPATPKTPTSSRRGILDNDPAIYLARDGESVEDEGIWDTATKWARLASKKLSLGTDRHSSSARGGGVGMGMAMGAESGPKRSAQGEYSVGGGLWRMVGSLGETADRSGS